MSPEPDPTATTGDRCAGCGAALAHDQRYCVACGTRRAPLPAGIAAMLDEIAAGEADPVARPAPPLPRGTSRPALTLPWGRIGLLPAARGLAVSVLLMLGVGSVIGASTASGGVGGLANTIVVAFHHRPAPAPTTLAAAGTTGPSASGHAGGGGGGGHHGGAAAPTPQAARTVTVSATGSGPPTTASSTGTTSTTATPTTTLPPIHHVWEIVLADQGYDQSFGTFKGYLAKTLADQGTVLADYDAVAQSPLANEVALVSGQGPTPQTLLDCPQYTALAPGTTGRHAQARGDGCVYPQSTETLGSELEIAGSSWRAYVQGIGSAAQRHPVTTSTTTTTTTTTTSAATTTSSTTSGSTTPAIADTSTDAGCPHPAIGADDPADAVQGADDYATWTNPWVYFASIVGSPTCARDDVGLSRLRHDLRREATTPAFSYIAPDPCDDGSDTPCTTGAPAGLAQADRFLRTVVPEIERSPAYRANGLILVTFSEAPQSGPNWSTASCCGQPTYPNLPATTTTSMTSTTTTMTTPTVAGTTGTGAAGTTATAGTTGTTTAGPTTTGDPPGGGQVGLLMISPYVPAHKLDEIHVYDAFSLLKSVSQLLGVTPLGYADETAVTTLSPALFTPTKR